MTVTRWVITAAVCACFADAVTAGQAQSADEKQIRALIAAEETGKRPARTADRIFWSGAYRRPTVGDERGEETPGEGQLANRIPKSETSKTTIRRIEIAKSNDFAYEFSDAVLSFDLKNGQRMSVPRSVLRVWKKEDGEWKEAAVFTRGHDTSPPAAR